RLWHDDGDNLLRSWDEHGWMIQAVAFSPTGRFAASCSGYGANYSPKVVAVYDLKTGSQVHRFSRRGPTERPWYTSLSFSADDQRLFATRSDATIQVWDLRKGTELPKIVLEGGPYDE